LLSKPSKTLTILPSLLAGNRRRPHLLPPIHPLPAQPHQTGLASRAPFRDTAKGLRSYQICHLTPPEFGGLMYDADNLRIMSVMQYALSSEVAW